MIVHTQSVPIDLVNACKNLDRYLCSIGGDTWNFNIVFRIRPLGTMIALQTKTVVEI